MYTTKSTHSSNTFLQRDFISSAELISHRGNESLRHVFLPYVSVAHSRLAFLDLSESSNQPLWSKNKEWILIFNGEIYNYQSIKSKIQSEFNYPFSSTGDSEVILAGFLCYREKIVNMLEGEYSFVIFKTDGTEVFAARDPYGVKPLFVWCEDIDTKKFSIAQESYEFKTCAFCFSSEIKGIFCKKAWNKDGFLRQATGLYEPIRTPFESIIQIPQGSVLWAKKNHEQNTFIVNLILNSKPIRTKSFQHYRNEIEIYQNFHEILEESVSDRMISDVELGVYLSGGIDSKTIAAYLANISHKKNFSSKNKFSNTKLKSFTVGFDLDDDFDETNDAVSFAHQAGYEPHVCRINYNDLVYSYPIAVYHSENIQPFTNGAAKWWLSLFTAKYVKGVLTGDGADEVFCGYPSFRYAAWWKFIHKNRNGKNIFDKLAQHPLGTNWRDNIYKLKFKKHIQNPWLSGSSHEGTGLDFLESLLMWGVAHPLFGEIKTISESLLGVEPAKEWLMAQKESVSSWFKFGFHENDDFYIDPQNALLLWQNYFCKTHLPVQILNWVGDRIEMANTLEGRPPFLSKKIKTFIYNLHDNFFIRGFEEKSILKRNFKKQFPQYANFIPTQKKQFNAPFLFSLDSDIYKNRIFGKVQQHNLIDTQILKNTFDKHFSNQKLINTQINALAESTYLNTALNSTFQTLLSFTYVDDFLMNDKKPERNFEYEDKKLNSVKMEQIQMK